MTPVVLGQFFTAVQNLVSLQVEKREDVRLQEEAKRKKKNILVKKIEGDMTN